MAGDIAGRMVPLLLLAGPLAACQGSAPPPSVSTDADCLYGTAADLDACANYDDDPERCEIEGGIYDAQTQRCLM